MAIRKRRRKEGKGKEKEERRKGFAVLDGSGHSSLMRPGEMFEML